MATLKDLGISVDDYLAYIRGAEIDPAVEKLIDEHWFDDDFPHKTTNKMNYEDLRQAAMVFNRINSIRNYVTKERFAMVASARFGIDDERKIDVMYGLINRTQNLVYYIANDTEEFRKTGRFSEYMKLLPKAIEIAESAYTLKPNSWDEGNVPYVEHGEYEREDKRRYFYTENGMEKTMDVNLHSRADIVLLSDLLQRNGVKFRGVAEHLGHLEGDVNGDAREKFHYYEGDIYFLFGDPTDRVFYDWYSHGDDAGVYIATKKGWRKLLYTPGRGYIDKKGNIEYVDEDHFYSDYMLEASGKKFKYIGNIHCDYAVLMDKKEGGK